MRLGVLDVGSNTVHLLVVDAHRGANPTPQHDERSVLRLSEHVGDDDVLSKEGEKALLKAVQSACDRAEKLDCDELMALVTSAIREADNGLEVLSTRSLSEQRRLLDESATGWGLLLALFTATLSLLLAAVMLVVVAVAAGRIVTRDIAALRVAGVSGSDLRGAAVREALTPVVVAGAMGALCGVVGSVLAMPLIPLFDTPAVVPALDLAPAWGVMAASWLVALAVLGVVSVVLALRSARQGDSERLREAW